ncbi:MAG: nucleotide exchange factor GrpE [Terrimicrobiaceae bacterium]
MNSQHPEEDKGEEIPLEPVEETPETTGAGEASSAEDGPSELEKYRDLALRSRAELDNYRKRVVREKEESIRYANLSLLERILPVVDNFDLGLEAARSAEDPSSVISGLDMVRKQLADFLRDQGVDAIDAEGQPFDPNLHEAMGSEASLDVPEGSVVRQLRKGYKLKDRLLRPASVFVSNGPAAE